MKKEWEVKVHTLEGYTRWITVGSVLDTLKYTNYKFEFLGMDLEEKYIELKEM